MRLMSGKLREYETTMPATVPAANSKRNNAVTPATRSNLSAPDGRGGLRARDLARPRAVALRATTRSGECAREHPVDEPARIFGRELLGQLDRFVDDDRWRGPAAMQEL